MGKKYILIGPAHGIGGWQLYIDARCKHLMDKDFDFYLVYDGRVGGNDIKLLNTKAASKIEVLMDEPYWFSQKHIQKEIKRIVDFIKFENGDEVFVESTSMIYSFWGELIAEAVKGQNFSYILHSHTNGMPLAWKKYFSFKYDQDLIAGQTDNTLPELFEDYRNLSGNDKRTILAGWESPICEFRDDCVEYINYLDRLKKDEYKLLGYFGVLRKPHFPILCEDLIAYAEKHQTTKFCIVAIGSSGRETEELLIDDINNRKLLNCIAYNIPEMYPIPKKIFNSLDVCVASFGSATTAAMGCDRTIRLRSDLDLAVQGVVGLTVSENQHWLQPVRAESVDDILDEVLFGNNYSGIKYEAPPPWPWGGRHGEIDKQMRPFENRLKGHEYFNILKMPMDGGISIVKYTAFHLLGIERGRNIAKAVRKIIRRG